MTPKRGDRGRYLRPWLAGLLTGPAAVLALTAVSIQHWPEKSGVIDFQRMLESLVPQMAVAGSLLALLLMGLGRIRLALVLIALNGAGLGQVVWRTWQDSQPLAPAAKPVLTVLWFNLFKDNPLPPRQLLDALIASPADVVMLAEASPLRGLLDDPKLKAAFPVQLGCRGEYCELLVLARDPAAKLSVRDLYKPRVERIMRVELKDLPGVPDLTLLGMQLYKPWFLGPAGHDDWFAVDEIGLSRGPLVVMGDFNDAPWSHRIAGTIHRLCGVRGQRWPIATWPSGLGPLGVALDQMLTRSGAEVVNIRRWGADLGSNHAGLLAQIAVDPGAPAREEDCRVPLDETGRPAWPAAK